MISLQFDSAAFGPVIEEIVERVLARLGQAQGNLPEQRLAFSEAEAAKMIGLNVHQLRDERLRGRIGSSRIVGNRVAYLRDDLLTYMARHRAPAA
jgi:hypothetical protein